MEIFFYSKLDIILSKLITSFVISKNMFRDVIIYLTSSPKTHIEDFNKLKTNKLKLSNSD